MSQFLSKTYTNDEPEIIKPIHCRGLRECKHTVITERVNCLPVGILCNKWDGNNGLVEPSWN